MKQIEKLFLFFFYFLLTLNLVNDIMEQTFPKHIFVCHLYVCWEKGAIENNEKRTLCEKIENAFGFSRVLLPINVEILLGSIQNKRENLVCWLFGFHGNGTKGKLLRIKNELEMFVPFHKRTFIIITKLLIGK